MEPWIDAESGEKIKKSNIVGVGPVKAVNVNPGAVISRATSLRIK